jgi:hypothetical protein
MRGEKDFWEWLKQKYPEFDKLSLDVFHMQIAWNARAGDSDANIAIQQASVADLTAAAKRKMCCHCGQPLQIREFCPVCDMEDE